jgi:uncharacterized protein (DUF1330 family)
MHLNQIKSTEEQMAQLMAYPKNTPLTMINILKFKKMTENVNETGKAAYARYFKNVQPLVAQSKAKLIWKGAVASTVVGDSAGEPDLIYLVEYPSVDHFIKLISHPEYQKISEDRTIALEYGGLIACKTL